MEIKDRHYFYKKRNSENRGEEQMPPYGANLYRKQIQVT